MLAAEPDHEWARMSQDEANPVTEQVADEIERVAARLDEAKHFAREQGLIADAAINNAWAEVVRGTREAQEGGREEGGDGCEGGSGASAKGCE